MAMGLEADSLGIVDDVHELVVDHSDSSVGDARDAHEVAVSQAILGLWRQVTNFHKLERYYPVK